MINTIDRQTVDTVKQVLKEIEEEKIHADVHGRINAKLAREVPIGKVGAAKCGICGQIGLILPSTTSIMECI